MHRRALCARASHAWPHSVEDRFVRTSALFDALAERHALPAGWSLAFDRAKRRLGQCNYARKRITLSSAYVAAPSRTAAEVENTLLHEMAHVLAPGAGHGAKWRSAALAIGCDAERTAKVAPFAAPLWTLRCAPGCVSVPRYRRSKLNRRLRCASCGGKLRFVAHSGADDS
jgi:predicted SprT family Zn-dependent metalloprotease